MGVTVSDVLAVVDRVAARVRAVPLGLQNRMVGLLLAGPTGLVLAIARALTPDPAGVGTHRQLGLGGCALLTFTGTPCPMCGMTTTFSHLAHLEIWQGVINQPFGLILFALTVLSFSVGAYDLLTGVGLWRRLLRVVERWETHVAVALMIGLILGWTYKIAAVQNFL